MLPWQILEQDIQNNCNHDMFKQVDLNCGDYGKRGVAMILRDEGLWDLGGLDFAVTSQISFQSGDF